MKNLNVPWPTNPDYFLVPLEQLEIARPCDGVFLFLRAATEKEPERIIYIGHSHAGGDIQETMAGRLRGFPQIRLNGANHAAFKLFHGNDLAQLLMTLEREVHELKEKFQPLVP
jgi:hypothetical protein